MNITIGNRRISGSLSVPAYEPLLHKYLICQALTKGHEPLQNYGASTKVIATIGCLEELGDGGNVEHFNCSDSEVSYRYILPVAAAMGRSSQFFISEQAMAQPMDDFLKTLKVHGIKHEYMDRNNMRIWGRLTAGTYILPAYINAQYISGLLFALPLLKENSVIMIDGILEDVEDIAQTIKVLSDAGIVVEGQINQLEPGKTVGKSFIGATFKIQGSQKYNLSGLPDIEGDWNIAAYMLTAGAVCGGPVTVIGVSPESVQKGTAILSVFKDAGAAIEVSEDRIKVTGPWSDDTVISQFFQREHLKAFQADAGEIRELIPAMTLLASAAQGTSCIANASDGSEEAEEAIQALIEIMEQFGIMIWESEGSLYIEGYAKSQPLSGGLVDSFKNPYLALMEGIASSISSNSVIIENADAVEIIYPSFYEDLIRLRR